MKVVCPFCGEEMVPMAEGFGIDENDILDYLRCVGCGARVLHEFAFQRWDGEKIIDIREQKR